MTDADRLERKWLGVRVGYVLVGVLCFFATLGVIATQGTVVLDAEALAAMARAGVELTAEDAVVVVLDQEQVWSTMQWLIITIGAAIFGDTVRPSGKKSASFGISPKGG